MFTHPTFLKIKYEEIKNDYGKTVKGLYLLNDIPQQPCLQIIIFYVYFQCTNNGISYSKVTNNEDNNTELVEIFFSGYPKMVGLNLFPNLKKLVIMNQSTIQKIEGLISVKNVSELWICECDILVSNTEITK